MSDAPPAWWDDLHEAIVLLRDGRVVAANRAAGELFGFEPSAAPGMRAPLALRDHRIERVWRDGERRTVDVRGRRVEVRRIDGGVALRDVDEAVRAREEARELLAVLSHELRTPATAMVSTLEALGYDDLDAGARDRLTARAVQEGERMVRLLDDLTVEVRPPRERTVAPADLVDRACAALAPILERERVRVRAEVSVPWIRADPDKALQVLVNLIENAAEHGPSDAEVEVRVEADPEGERARFVVRDRGTPFPEGAAEALFAPYAQGPSPKRRGTGLGLWVVRAIAERWGGEAWGGPWRDASGTAVGNEFGASLPSRR